jgi:hypothetical protein
MVELFLAKEGIGVRFPLAAPKENASPSGGAFSFVYTKLKAAFKMNPLNVKNVIPLVEL